MIISKGVVSVIIPTYNREKLIIETISSVQSQTYSNIEILVIDDGSSDNTNQVLSSFIKSRHVKYIFQENKGLSAARNEGIRQSTGEFVAFLDSDDLFLPDKIKSQVKFFNSYPDISIVHCDFEKFDDVGNLGIRDTSYFQESIYPNILWHWKMLMATSCVMLRRTILDHLGGFDENLSWAEDLDLWARFARYYMYGHIPHVLVKIRVHEEEMSFDKRDLHEKFEVYLNKAFDRDPDLPNPIRNKAMANMYLFSGLNMLGSGNKEQMQIARYGFKKSLQYKICNIFVIVGWIISFVSQKYRISLYHLWEQINYRRGKRFN